MENYVEAKSVSRCYTFYTQNVFGFPVVNNYTQSNKAKLQAKITYQNNSIQIVQ
jgi:hypothetical protein